MLSQQDELGHAIAAAVLFGAHVDDVLQMRETLGVEMPSGGREHFGNQLMHDIQIVDIAVAIDDAQGLHVGLFQHIAHLMALVHGIHGNQHDADLGGGVHEGQPVGDITCPNAQVIARLEADGQKAAGQIVGTLVEIAIGPAQAAVGIDHELMVGIDRNHVAEVRTDRLFGMHGIILLAFECLDLGCLEIHDVLTTEAIALDIGLALDVEQLDIVFFEVHRDLLQFGNIRAIDRKLWP